MSQGQAASDSSTREVAMDTLESMVVERRSKLDDPSCPRDASENRR